MHELILYGQVPTKRYEQILNILAGMTGSQPQRRIERHVIYRPIRNPPKEDSKSLKDQSIATKSQKFDPKAKELYYVRLVKNLKQSDFGTSSEPLTNDDWRLVFWDIMDPAIKEVMMRAAMETELETDDVEAYMTNLQYKQHNHLIFDGQQYVYGNIVLHLHTLRHFLDPQPTEPTSPLPKLGDIPPVDPNSYLLQATVRVTDGTNTDQVKQGIAELQVLQQRLENIIDLYAPGRFDMPSRIWPAIGPAKALERAAMASK
ncbi:hypothetical protein BT63DRAFT_138670 [Microthyrium microscopicum]|uniref:Mediator of RNA polymerase II transcription subunit 18 n=1 Tax=Microthyrium microscopicum TaxID=703497 RepID=A0A6A6UP59_9PEZI|nr:hypothetical protein BT63DRAFT_138670 [Microthyrium microscopicum]